MIHFKPKDWVIGDGVFRFLISYHYCKGMDVAKFTGSLACEFEFFLDSGAFSAETQGVPIKLDEYIRFITKYKKHFSVVAALDVIRDPAASLANLEVMENAGLKPLPAYHFGSPYSALEELMERGYRYIALGGMVGQPWPKVQPWIEQCLARAHRYTQKTGSHVGFHGFGQTRVPALKRYQWNSVDSSSWGSAYRFGTVKLFDPMARDFVSFDLRDFGTISKQSDLIRAYGFDPDWFIKHHPDKRNLVAGISALGWKAFETALKAKRKKKGNVYLAGKPLEMKWGSQSMANSLYLADNVPKTLTSTSKIFGQDVFLAEGSPDNIQKASSMFSEEKS